MTGVGVQRDGSGVHCGRGHPGGGADLSVGGADLGLDAPDQERGGGAEDGEGGQEEEELGLLGAEEGPQRPQAAARRHREHAQRQPVALTGHCPRDVRPASEGAGEETGQTLRVEHERCIPLELGAAQNNQGVLVVDTGSCPVQPNRSFHCITLH